LAPWFYHPLTATRKCHPYEDIHVEPERIATGGGDITFRPKTHARFRPIHDPNKIKSKGLAQISSETFVFKSVKISHLFGQFVRILFYRHDFFLRLCLAALIFFCNPLMTRKKDRQL